MLGSLILKYQDKIYNVVYRLCGSHHTTEEICQEAFCNAIQKIDKFRQDCQFYTWLYRIAVNLTISYNRRKQLIKFYTPELWVEEIQDNRRPEDTIIFNEDCNAISHALKKLNEDYSTAIILRDMEGLQYAQISNILGMPIGTIKSRVARARKILRDNLSEHF